MIIYEEILRAFQKEKVKYVLVGGIAVNLLGSLRSTADLDILVEMSGGNLKKTVTILKRMGYRIKQPVDPMLIADEKIRKQWIKKKHMKALSFCKEKGLKEVDIIVETPVSFEDAKRDAVRFKGGDISIPVISINNLIKMKRSTGRSIDKLDVAELRKIKKLRSIR
ncbi:MAG: hypothetical protein QME65_06640 [Candidatus Omnitrophota bacterium]|nr:hypothetical protein [Candidatus Omnitrophota bacterium]